MTVERCVPGPGPLFSLLKQSRAASAEQFAGPETGAEGTMDSIPTESAPGDDSHQCSRPRPLLRASPGLGDGDGMALLVAQRGFELYCGGGGPGGYELGEAEWHFEPVNSHSDGDRPEWTAKGGSFTAGGLGPPAPEQAGMADPQSHRWYQTIVDLKHAEVRSPQHITVVHYIKRVVCTPRKERRRGI